MGFLTDGINNKLEKSNVINEHALNREPVPLIVSKLQINYFFFLGYAQFLKHVLLCFHYFRYSQSTHGAVLFNRSLLSHC